MQHAAPRVEELFYAALELEGSEARSAFLARACGDTELRRRVEELLNVDPGLNEFLEAPASMATVTAAPDSRLGVEEPGTAVGPYKLLEAIGEGGMGVVYVAEQAGPVRRKVALKVIKPGMDSKQVVARFEAERQALAMMDHPNIARVFDARTTSAGRPYFVMELVRGLPITEYCDQHQLSIPERLELFTLVCRAVQHAHQKGVIHRDLKPSNVLVTVVDGVGVPKVIDFGIAKATGGALTDKTVYTGFHQFVGTPLYASPEQAELSGSDVDTRSDIYSLGVLLYELLTGTTPFDSETLRRAAFDEMRRIIREEEPPRPSTRLGTLGERLSTVSAMRKADPKRLGLAIKGELDWVVMKSLEKDRRRRYETAGEFAADVLNHLADRPVEAVPPSTRYRFAKFARRNRVALTTAGLLTTISIAALVIGGLLVWREKEQTRRALVQSQAHAKAADERLGMARRAVDEMYTQVAEKWLAQQPHLTAVQTEFLEKALAFYRQFAAERGDDLRMQLDAVRARKRVGGIEEALGRHDRADAAYRAMLGELERLASLHPGDAACREELAWTLAQLGKLQWDHNQFREAEALDKRSIAIREELVARHPEDANVRSQLAGTIYNLGSIYIDMGRFAEAEPVLRRSVAMFEKLRTEHPNDVEYAERLAHAEDGLGRLLSSTARPAEAVQALERSLRLREEVLAADPKHQGHRLQVATGLINLNSVSSDKPAMAERDRRSIDILTRLAEEYPDRPRYREVLVLNRTNYAITLRGLGRMDEAREILRATVPEAERLVRDFPRFPDHRANLAKTLQVLSAYQHESGDAGQSEKTARRAGEVHEALVSEFPDRVRYRAEYAEYLTHEVERRVKDPDASRRDPAGAVEVARRACELNPEGDLNWKWLAVAEYCLGDWDAAIRAAEKCIAVRGDGGWTFQFLVLAAAHARRGESQRAREWYEKARPGVAAGHLADTPRWLVGEASSLLEPEAPPTERAP
ncbi:serine/threonine-protein kinase [Paludisphaera soli]|uniref:serine/threonine-protein kinase n=1 Tax=Paludisphaera soli TaxID=2712865 RepID=UPI0013EAE6C6|nr:serine/threonine-protein kinase [Paludisphaera soli]